MAQDTAAVAAPAAAATTTTTTAAAPAAAATTAAPAAAAPAPDAAAITAAETAFAQALAAAQGKPADSAEAKAAATARSAYHALVKPAPARKAPEAYEFKAPEGVTLDKTVTTEVQTVAKELDLSQAEAQKLIDRVAPVLAKSQEASLTAFVTQRADAWRAATLADPEIGGEKVEANLAIAKKAWDAFGTPALRDVLNKTGLGDNPELLRWAFRVGQHIGPDNKIVNGSLPSAGVRAPEDVLWPDKK